jgi:hypothetical protein
MFNLNRDQVFSLTNHFIGIAGVFLATSGGMTADMQVLILGAITATMSAVISVWFNTGNLLDQVTSATRKVFMAVGSYATMKGWISGEQVASWSGPVLMAATLFWSQFFYRDAPGPDLPGTTIN